MTRVPYRGSAPILNDIIGGHISFGIATLADALPQHRAKGVKIVAVASAERSPFAPDVPTLKESGIDLVADAWYGMWLPAGSSPEFASKLGAAASAALAKPEVKEKLTAIGLIPVGSTAEGLTKELAANTAFWQPIVKATGYKIEITINANTGSAKVGEIILGNIYSFGKLQYGVEAGIRSRQRDPQLLVSCSVRHQHLRRIEDAGSVAIPERHAQGRVRRPVRTAARHRPLRDRRQEGGVRFGTTL